MYFLPFDLKHNQQNADLYKETLGSTEACWTVRLTLTTESTFWSNGVTASVAADSCNHSESDV